jgi:hypothetical protein
MVQYCKIPGGNPSANFFLIKKFLGGIYRVSPWGGEYPGTKPVTAALQSGTLPLNQFFSLYCMFIFMFIFMYMLMWIYRCRWIWSCTFHVFGRFSCSYSWSERRRQCTPTLLFVWQISDQHFEREVYTGENIVLGPRYRLLLTNLRFL